MRFTVGYGLVMPKHDERFNGCQVPLGDSCTKAGMSTTEIMRLVLLGYLLLVLPLYMAVMRREAQPTTYPLWGEE